MSTDVLAQQGHVGLFCVDVSAADPKFALDPTALHQVVHAVEALQKGRFSAT